MSIMNRNLIKMFACLVVSYNCAAMHSGAGLRVINESNLSNLADEMLGQLDYSCLCDSSTTSPISISDSSYNDLSGVCLSDSYKSVALPNIIFVRGNSGKYYPCLSANGIKYPTDAETFLFYTLEDWEKALGSATVDRWKVDDQNRSDAGRRAQGVYNLLRSNTLWLFEGTLATRVSRNSH